MNVVDYVVLSAFTVPKDYTWDKGMPLETVNTTTTAFTTQSYISGYAPAVKVYFYNDTLPLTGFDNVTYEWNFGDYYNDATNVFALTCNSIIEHIYLMPGIYSVSLKLLQSKTTEEFDITGNSQLCRGRYGIRWFWDELLDGKTTCLTWDETACGARREKWWEDESRCLEKYCKVWAWQDLKTDSSNPVYWDETSTDAEYVKKWSLEANDTICKVNDADYLSTSDSVEQTLIKTHLIEVKELPPIASMYCVTRPVTGYSPFTVQLTPRLCQAGSFPIDRIDWDFGDGSPVKIVSRYTSLTGGEIVHSNAFSLDMLDVRNYDIMHTYKKTSNDYPVFYPSLTCYSANTFTSDSCSIAIGPVALSSVTGQSHLLKVRNTLKGNLYTFDMGEKVTFFSTNENIQTETFEIPVPSNTLRDGYGARGLGYYGNNGLGYPPEYEANCDLQVLILPDNYIATEDSTPTTITDMLSDDGFAILSETNLAFIP